MTTLYYRKDANSNVLRFSTILVLLRLSIFVFFILFYTLPPISSFALDLHGFSEGAYGARFEEDGTEKDNYNLLEGRLQLKGAHAPELLDNWYGEFAFKVDLLHDHYDETSKGILRKAVLTLTPHDNLDLKIGRQILTWGTGDFLFINDLFPKDFVSFFIGRDDEYLKLPSDAFKTSFFLKKLNIDFVLIPQFTPNDSIDGERLSFYNGLMGSIVGQNGAGNFYSPPHTINNVEKALRLYRTFGSWEGALYVFRGFYKEPLGVSNAADMDFFYPELSVYGFSLRGPFAGGIGNMEFGYYDSRNDKSGADPFIENSDLKYLLGYSKDMGGDFRTGVQYQLEQMLDYDRYRVSLATGSPVDDEYRHLFTLRLTKLWMNQTLDTSLFCFYSPSDEDYHLRPKAGYKFTDNLSLAVGANIFEGKKDHTFFGQLNKNDNVFTRMRYSF